MPHTVFKPFDYRPLLVFLHFPASCSSFFPLSFILLCCCSPSLPDKPPLKRRHEEQRFSLSPLFFFLSLSLSSGCSWRVSQLCLSSRTHCLITWIVWPNIGIPLYRAPPPPHLFCPPLQRAAVTCQCQSWPSLSVSPFVLTHLHSPVSQTHTAPSFFSPTALHTSFFLSYLGSILHYLCPQRLVCWGGKKDVKRRVEKTVRDLKGVTERWTDSSCWLDFSPANWFMRQPSHYRLVHSLFICLCVCGSVCVWAPVSCLCV